MMHRLLPTNYAENRLGARDERVEPAEEATRCAGGHVRRTSARAERCNMMGRSEGRAGGAGGGGDQMRWRPCPTNVGPSGAVQHSE
jgi:hypothetical protein